MMKEIFCESEIPKNWQEFIMSGNPTDDYEITSREEFLKLFKDGDGTKIYQLNYTSGVLVFESCGHMHPFYTR